MTHRIADTECPGCNRTEERTTRGWRRIVVRRNGLCRACTEAAADAAQLEREQQRAPI